MGAVVCAGIVGAGFALSRHRKFQMRHNIHNMN